jgi:RNA polymerase sigma-70 factor (ECF subfamily)
VESPANIKNVELFVGRRTLFVVRTYEDLDDAELWELSTKDPEAFGEIFRRHARSVFAICYWRTGDAAMAEDVTSVVFLEAWRRRELVVLEQRSALPWLLGVANHTSRNATRSLRRYGQALRRLDGHRNLPSDDDVIDRIDAETSLNLVNEVARDLSDQEREIVLLVFWSGLSYEATAVALGVPVGTVRSRVSRTRRKLQLRLGDNRVTKEAT